MGEWRLSRLLKQENRVVRLLDEQHYKLLGVKWYGKGVFLREEKKGSEIKAEKLYQVRTGDFIYNRLFAWKSSFAIVPEEFDGCLVSNEFPTFTAADDQLSLEFLLRYILLPQNIEQVNRVSGGMSSVSRKRFKETEFLEIAIPKLSLEQQQTLCEIISRRETILAELETEKTGQLSLLKQLRQAVLQEAIEGKLTEDWRKLHPVVKGDPQYDAAALLTQIKAEKEQLIKEGKIRKEKPLPPIADADKTFDLPDGWVWVRLGDAGLFARGKSKHRPRNDAKLFTDGCYPFIQTGDVSKSKYTGYTISSYSKSYNDTGLKQSQMWEKGTLCITIAANIAETGFLGFDACFPDSVVGFKSCSGELTPKFVRFFLSQAQENIIKFAPATAQKNINLDIIGSLVFPLPSLTEQQAIVARVDSLMAVIDELEKQVAERKEQVQLLMKTVLREAFEENNSGMQTKGTEIV